MAKESPIHLVAIWVNHGSRLFHHTSRMERGANLELLKSKMDAHEGFGMMMVLAEGLTKVVADELYDSLMAAYEQAGYHYFPLSE